MFWLALAAGMLVFLGSAYQVLLSMWLSATPTWQDASGAIEKQFWLGVAGMALGLVVSAAAGVWGHRSRQR